MSVSVPATHIDNLFTLSSLNNHAIVEVIVMFNYYLGYYYHNQSKSYYVYKGYPDGGIIHIVPLATIYDINTDFNNGLTINGLTYSGNTIQHKITRNANTGGASYYTILYKYAEILP